MTATRVVIVDDHDLFRSRLRALLEAAGYEVVGEAADGEQALLVISEQAPEVVLLDVQLPGRDGFSIAEELATRVMPPIVVLISSRDAADYGRQLEQATVRGFIHKPDLSRARLARLVGAPQ